MVCCEIWRIVRYVVSWEIVFIYSLKEQKHNIHTNSNKNVLILTGPRRSRALTLVLHLKFSSLNFIGECVVI